MAIPSDSKTYGAVALLPYALEIIKNNVIIDGIIGIVFAYCIWRVFRNMEKSVVRKFKNPDKPPLIREGYHFPRKEEDEIRKAFLNKTDTLGLVGVVFGPAGTGKSNVVRTVCSKTHDGHNVKGVIYMEIGSPRQFAFHLAKVCGVRVESNWFDAVVSKMFPAWKTNITLPTNDEDALAIVLPVIAEGGRARHTRRIITTMSLFCLLMELKFSQSKRAALYTHI